MIQSPTFIASRRAGSQVAFLAVTLVLIASLVVVAPWAQGAETNRYVATSGSETGTNDCSVVTSPCRYIGQALGKSSTGDIIQIAPGTYTEDLSIGQDITLARWDDGATGEVIISGTTTAITVEGGITTLDQLTVTGNGEGIRTRSAGSVVMENSSIINNSTDGIFNQGSTTVISSVISENGGDGIFDDGTLVVKMSTISDNGSNGITMFNDGSATVTTSTISGHADDVDSSGIRRASDGDLVISSSTFAQNSNGVLLDAAVVIASAPTAVATVTPNYPLRISNSTFTANQIGVNAIATGIQRLNLTTSTLAGNDTGILVTRPAGIAVAGSIVADNSVNCAVSGTSSTLTDLGYNLTDKPGGVLDCGFNAAKNDVGPPSALGGLTDNGGPTKTMLPGSSSGAINQIPDGTVVSAGDLCPPTDQRGVARPQTSTCDIGAVEVKSAGSGSGSGGGSDGAAACVIGDVTRIGGENRFGTGAKLSASHFAPGVDVVYIASSTEFADALSGGVSAGLVDAPVLLVRRSGIPAETAAELERLNPGRVVILGGTTVIDDAVADALAAYTGGSVTRLFGSDRYATSAAIALATFLDGATTAFIASGELYPDALSGVPAAVVDDGPLLLTRHGSVPAVITDALTRLGVTKVVLLGGPEAISETVESQLAQTWNVSRVFGDNRFTTSTAISERTFTSPSYVYIASGRMFADALGGGAAAAGRPAPLLLSDTTDVPGPVIAEIRRLCPDHVIMLGGTKALTNAVESELTALTTRS